MCALGVLTGNNNKGENMSLELRNISGNMADIYETDTNCMITSWSFSSPPKLNDDINTKISTQKIIKLKEAGFETEDILKILKELDIE